MAKIDKLCMVEAPARTADAACREARRVGSARVLSPRNRVPLSASADQAAVLKDSGSTIPTCFRRYRLASHTEKTAIHRFASAHSRERPGVRQ
jgi:hypothetical protein